MIEYVLDRLSALDPAELRGVLAADAVLVPVPRSAPFPPRQASPLWVPRRIAEALVVRGRGREIAPVLARTIAVRKSAGATDRPLPATHLASFEVVRTIDEPSRIVLVDDVITKGATLLAAASAIRSAYPRADVTGFALVRTLGLVPDVDRIVSPVVGRIRLGPAGSTEREP